MRNTWKAAVLLAGFACAAPAAASNSIPEGVDWVDDWNTALVQAAERGAPVLISFANDD